MKEKGSISVDAQNIFPIIKQWLYSDKDIFLRELVSNAADAAAKLKKLADMGETDIGSDELTITVALDEKNKTITISDNGIGMTADEVKKFINQVAFSGAQDFMEKYSGENEKSQIIGHFGLGFYSAFMVSDLVEINTLSYQENAAPVLWQSDGGTEFTMTDGSRTSRGTDIILHISEDSKGFLSESKLTGMLEKYCSFMAFPITFQNAEKEDEAKQINDTHPLWLSKPGNIKDEKYIEFYKKVFHDYQDPIFWIHINVEYPFTLKGILYFPKMNNEMELLEGQIKLYNNQVFVADNIKEVIPEYLFLLKGVIDCSDLPLNVSRSFLQNDAYVEKVKNHITKKVADKLTSLHKNKPEQYQGYWDEISIFVKYGCMKDEKFFDKAKSALLFKTVKGEYLSLEQLKEKEKVVYTTDEKQQSQYINMYENMGIDTIVLNTVVDTHFVNFLEFKAGLKLFRVDGDIEGLLDKDKEQPEEHKRAAELFKEILGDSVGEVKTENIQNDAVPAMVILPEQMRRMKEMAKMMGGGNADMGDFVSKEYTLILNQNNPIIEKVVSLPKDSQDQKLLVQYIYDVALMGFEQFSPEKLTSFMQNSNQICSKLVELLKEEN